MAYHKQNNKYAVGVQKEKKEKTAEGLFEEIMFEIIVESLKQEFKNPRRVSNSK